MKGDVAKLLAEVRALRPSSWSYGDIRAAQRLLPQLADALERTSPKKSRPAVQGDRDWQQTVNAVEPALALLRNAQTYDQRRRAANALAQVAQSLVLLAAATKGTVMNHSPKQLVDTYEKHTDGLWHVVHCCVSAEEASLWVQQNPERRKCEPWDPE